MNRRYHDTFEPSSVQQLQIERMQKSFDKAIVTLRIALSKLGETIENNDENWLLYEILMQHKNMLHSEIHFS
jgi:hypothetical protein